MISTAGEISIAGRLIKSEGYEVIQFASADSFVAGSVDEQLTCTIVDLRKPGLNGIELQQNITQMLPHVAFVILTGQAGIQDSEQAMKGGAVDFLEKPVSEIELFAAIRYGVAHSQAARRELEQLSGLQDRYELLTRRERECSDLSRRGCSTNKSHSNSEPPRGPSKRIAAESWKSLVLSLWRIWLKSPIN